MEITSLSLPPLHSGGEVITFYSYKGGTGRTMALSNIAVLLARQRNATAPVLMIDWDLEAPGLHHYFEHPHEHEHKPGVLEFFEACHEQLQRRRHDGATLDDETLAYEVLAAVGWEQYVSRVDEASQLYLMRAGRLDETFPERLAAMQWEALFHSCPALFRCFAERMARHFRYVLVDSRTGRTDVAGICTTLLPRKLVLVFTPNRQSLDGVQAVVQRATTYRRSHEDEQRPLMVYPLPSRMEMDDSAQRAQWRRGDAAQQIAGYQSGFEQVLRDSYGVQQVSLESYFDEVQLQQTRALAYGEQVAVRQDQGDGDRFSLTRTFESLLAWLAPGYFPWQSLGEIQLQAAIGEARQALEEGGAGARAVAPSLARDLHALGELYRREGRLRQALSSFEESLSLRQRGLGEDHPDTLLSKVHLAATLRQQGRLDEALFLAECIVDARQRTLGADHIDTLGARADLAETLGLLGRLSEALPLQEGVLDTYLRLLGPEHLLTLAAKAGRAQLLLQRGEVELARAVQEQVLDARKRLLGKEHAETLRARTALAKTLLQMQDAGEAPPVPEVHQNASMDDYGDALLRSPRRHSAPVNSPWPRQHDDLLALDGHPRNTPR